jgi:hypothetical protein
LGTLLDFVLYTALGVTNVAVSTITGNIGSDSGSIIGFELATVNGAFATTYTSVTSTTIFTANTNIASLAFIKMGFDS